MGPFVGPYILRCPERRGGFPLGRALAEEGGEGRRGARNGRPFPHHKTGYKDPRNNCNRTDRRNGGEFSTYESLYQVSHAHVSNMPVKFCQDGIPTSARRVDGIPLMSPKLPSRADLTAGRALSKKYSTTKIQLGNPHVKDPKHYKTVSKLMYPKYKRTTYAETNPGIAAEESRRSHHRVWGCACTSRPALGFGAHPHSIALKIFTYAQQLKQPRVGHAHEGGGARD